MHLIRHSLRHVPRRSYDQVVKDLRPIYTAVDADAALAGLEAFEEKWGQQLAPVVKAWRDAWEHVIPFLAFPEEVRRVIYTTDESVKGGGLISGSGGACGGARLAVRGGRSSAGMPAKPGQDGVAAWLRARGSAAASRRLSRVCGRR